MKNINAAFYIQDSLWSGGIDYLRDLIYALENSKKNKFNIFIFIKQNDNLKYYRRYLKYYIKKMIEKSNQLGLINKVIKNDN